MTTPTNRDRAGWAKEALRTFIQVTGVDNEDAVADLVCDLRHLCDQEESAYGVYSDQDGRAYRNYLADVREEAEPRPPVLELPVQSDGESAAQEFMTELMESVETLTGVAETYGGRTLADLMYLQNAILTGGFIDSYPDESSVSEIVSKLPSGSRWSTYIKAEYLAGTND